MTNVNEATKVPLKQIHFIHFKSSVDKDMISRKLVNFRIRRSCKC